MRFLNPLGFLALLGIPVIILLYLLKQKYKEQEVSSLFLWKKAQMQSLAQEPWQKLKKNILMFFAVTGSRIVSNIPFQSLCYGWNANKSYSIWFGLLFEYAGKRRRKWKKQTGTSKAGNQK